MKYLQILSTCLLLLLSNISLSTPLFWDQPETLASLESKGYSLPLLLSQKDHANNQAFYKDSKYRSLVDTLAADLAELKAGDAFLSVTMAKKHRLFDSAWLKSPHAYYELVGIANRIDRLSFSGNKGFHCGEIRLIYRLSYKKKTRNGWIYSRLPLTINAVFWAVSEEGKAQAQDCTLIAQDWQQPDILAQLPHSNRLSLKHLKSLEVNMQSIRWPSTVRPDFGGYAEYLMRVFHLESRQQALIPAPMENMIDVEKIQANSHLKQDLKNLLNDPAQAKAFDQGIGKLPDKFLATKARSVAFHGMARLANRPFDQVFSEADFKQIDYSQFDYAKSPFAYLRRLNDMSCVGCHQGRAIAGFHFVGIDKQETEFANAVTMAKSGHLRSDLQRRQQFINELLKGKTPNPARGFSERLDTEEGQYGAHCSLGTDSSFSQWSCAANLTCQSIDSAVNNKAIGTCLPETNQFAGDPCDTGRVTQDLNPRKDRIINKISRQCRQDQACFTAGNGFPGGLCYSECSNVQEGEACGAIAFNGFNQCLGRNEPFTQCLQNYTGGIALKACDEQASCRDDFVCARTGENTGACIPPYFLFQLRLDGHPRP